MSADAPLPTTATAMYVAGSHSEPYTSRKIAFAGTTQEGERHAERESLPGEEGDDAARRRVAHRVRSA